MCAKTGYFGENISHAIRGLSFAIRLFFTGLRVLTTAIVYGLIAAFALPALAGLLAPLAPAALLPLVHAITGATALVLHSLSVAMPVLGLISAMTAQLMLLGMVVGSTIAVLGAMTKDWIRRLTTPLHRGAVITFQIRNQGWSIGEMARGDCNMAGYYPAKVYPNEVFDIFVDAKGMIFNKNNMNPEARCIPQLRAARIDQLLKLLPADRLQQPEIVAALQRPEPPAAVVPPPAAKLATVPPAVAPRRSSRATVASTYNLYLFPVARSSRTASTEPVARFRTCVRV